MNSVFSENAINGTASVVDTPTNDSATLSHFQTTLPSSKALSNNESSKEKQGGPVQGEVLSETTHSTNTSGNASPGRIPPSRTSYSSRTPTMHSTRFVDSPSEQSSSIPRMSTVPENEVPEEAARVKRSVQFTGEPPDIRDSPAQIHTPTEEGRVDGLRPQSLYSRLRALASAQGLTHVRSASGTSMRSIDGRDPVNGVHNDAAVAAVIEDENTETDGDADGESGTEHSNQPRNRKRRRERINHTGSDPSSPDLRPGLPPSTSTRNNASLPRPLMLIRRATDTDAGLSGPENKGKTDSLQAWSPRHPLRGLSYGISRQSTKDAPNDDSQRSAGEQNGAASTTDVPRPSRRRLLQARTTTISAARWNKIKSGIRFLGREKKKERTQDQQKSAELLAELAAGSPAALMVASMFQRDEHGSRRIPALLEQLKVQITDSDWDKYKDPGNPQPGDKHMVFRIELEYGNGINRMKWTVRRSLREFLTLHSKYKLRYQTEKIKGRGESAKALPRFPRKAFPVLNSYRGFDDEEDEEVDEPVLGTDGEATDTERPGLGSRNRTARQSYMLRRRASSPNGDQTPTTPGGTSLFRRNRDTDRDRTYPERQRKYLELYLQKMIKFMLFRADANRLCKFLELSALGMRLSSEGSYHGKEGFLVIRSAKGIDFRKTLTPSNVKARHTPKWFLVRHSYIVCVDSPEAMHIYDVFLFDADFAIQSSKPALTEKRSAARELAASSKELAKHPQHHRLKLQNSERRLKLLARNERMLYQFEESIRSMIDTSDWCKRHRFDSFAPVRQKCFAQWLVDGRDHMWVVSRALNQAKDVIYIHDWWLSPELYMRRPPAISQKWRLDRILKRKAEQGVKIFIIVYRNIDAAVPIDSQYTKFSLLDLHPNVFVQRSPNQFRQNTFFWAHHEKLCIVDHTLAFVGGIDLCFGRWDTPQHILTDDKSTGFEANESPKDADHCQLWPGKDYSNPRVQDFYNLNKPYEEMYDRNITARMPWHDISMQVVGQPARDLTRHFVQRWNYILRQRKPTRPTPFLLPPPDFNPADLEALGLDGTCEVQLLRSAGPWSIGTPAKTEHSIMNAYVKMIEESEHFVYIENQFFITSCETEGSTVFNKIGDALVERITRAHNNDEVWKAVIVIPLIPGFQNTVEEEGGTSVRLIMQYQYRSICRGDSSIFGRLKALGIEPEEYIQFYSLRQWGKIGPNQALVTEQLYIHAKIIVVDDRVALIGSANINERSQLGNRDSEVAAIVRDTDMFWSKMNGLDYKVGRFAHSLRMRLMREHLGLDVDQIMEDAQVLEQDYQKQQGKTPVKPEKNIDDDDDEEDEDPLDARGRELQSEYLTRNEYLRTFNGDVDWEQANNPNLVANRKVTADSRVTGQKSHKEDLEGLGDDNMAAITDAGYGVGRDTIVLTSGKEVLINELDNEGHKPLVEPRKPNEMPRLPSYVIKRETPNPPMPPPKLVRMQTEELGLPMLSTLPALPDLDDSDIGGPTLERTTSSASSSPHHSLYNDLRFPLVDRDSMLDPLHYSFVDDIWHTVAENNTKIYRAVFRCMPDNLVRDWADYHEYMAYEQRFDHLQGRGASSGQKLNPDDEQSSKRAGPPGVGAGAAVARIKGINKIPTDIEKRAGELKDKIAGTIPDAAKNSPGKQNNIVSGGDEEKQALRNWAAEANRAQMKRTNTDLGMRPFPALDEKMELHSVPEDRPASNDSSEKSDTAQEKSSLAGTTATGSSNTANGVDNVNGNPVSATTSATPTAGGGHRRRRRGTTRSSRRDFSAADDIIGLAEAEELLGKVQGHLIEFPYDWLEKVEAGGNWLFPFDQISPIEIYI